MHSKNVLLVVGAALLSGLGILLVPRSTSRLGVGAPEPEAAVASHEPGRAPGALDAGVPEPAPAERVPVVQSPAASSAVAEVAAAYRDADAEALEIYRSDVERRRQRIRERIGFQRLSKGTCKHVKTQLGVPVDLGAAARADVEERFPGRKAYDGVWSASGSGCVEVVGIAVGESPEYDQLTLERDWISSRIVVLGGVSSEGVRACPVPGTSKSN